MIHSVQLVFGAPLIGNVVKDNLIREEERRRLALELHDQLGQSLTALKIAASSSAEALRLLTAAVAKLVDENRQTVAKKK